MAFVDKVIDKYYISVSWNKTLMDKLCVAI